MKYFLTFLFLISFALYGQKRDSILFKTICERPIIKEYQDTEYYHSGKIHSVARIRLKQLDNYFDIKLPIGITKHFYENGQLKDSALYISTGIPFKATCFYSDGKKKAFYLFDTTSSIIIKNGLHKAAIFSSIRYTIEYNQNGIIKSEGRKKKKKKTGDWIFYDKQGNIEKKIKYKDK